MNATDTFKFALAVFSVAAFLGFLVESFTEYFAGRVFDRFPRLAPYKWLLVYASAVFGIAVALHYQIDLVASLMRVSGLDHPDEIHGMLLSGLGIGRGANFIHEIWSKFFPKQTLAQGLSIFAKGMKG